MCFPTGLSLRLAAAAPIGSRFVDPAAILLVFSNKTVFVFKVKHQTLPCARAFTVPGMDDEKGRGRA
jgi:hypothetical protein